MDHDLFLVSGFGPHDWNYPKVSRHIRQRTKARAHDEKKKARAKLAKASRRKNRS